MNPADRIPTSQIPPLADEAGLAEALRGLGPDPLELILLVDDGPTMRVWKPTIEAFRRVAEGCGAFRRVEKRSLRAADEPPQRGRRVALVFTDGFGQWWRDSAAFDLLRVWSRAMAVAILDPYPQNHWHRTALPIRQLQIRAPEPMPPNDRLQLRESVDMRNPFDELLGHDAIAVPLLELEPRWLRWWVRLLLPRDDEWLDATVVIAGPDGPVGGGEPPAEPAAPPQESVLQFRAEASPTAFRLATLAAAAPSDLAALRVVQAELLPRSLPLHLAEVVTSPLLVKPDLAFRQGVRESLLAHSTRADTARVVDALSNRDGQWQRHMQALSRALRAPDDEPDIAVTPETLGPAEVELAVLRALAGPYARRAQRLRESIVEALSRAVVGGPPTVEPVASPTLPTPIESGATMSNPSSSTPLPQPPEIRGLPDPVSPTVPGMSVDALFANPEAPPRVTVWGNVPSRNGYFTGRQDLLNELEQRLRMDRVTAVLPHALHGMGGVGKSQIAAEYAYLHRSEYDVIWWIPAEQPGQIQRALVDLSQQLGLGVSPEVSTAVPAVREALRTGVPYQNWLLIFDNAETLETVQRFIPEGGTGRVLVTSRNPEWTGVDADALEIDVFTREESIELLRKRNLSMDREEASGLAEALGDLPLAVEHASAWLATTQTRVAEYLSLLAEKRVELTDVAVPPGYEMPVAAAWNVALDRLGMENPGALQLLQVCSFFAPEPIGRELFTSPRNAPISPHLDETLQNPSRLSRAFRDIQRYGLARIDYREPSIQLHRLVRAVLVSRLSEEQRSQMEHGAHVLLAGGNPGGPDIKVHWPRYHALLPHVVESGAVTCTDPWARQLVLDIIEFNYYWGDHDGCRDLARQVVNTWRETLGEDDLQTLKAAKWLGFVLRILGAFREAAEINKDCLERFQRIAAPDDEGTLDAMSLVAADLRAAGDFDAARDLDQEAFDKCRQAFGEDDPITLIAAHSLGVSLRLTGDFRAALALDADTCRRRAKLLSEEHALTLWTLNGYILDLRECGYYLQAHTDQEKLYERFQRVWGQDHPNTITAARNLAVSRRRAGMHTEGRKLAEETMNRLKERVGALHPDTIAAALNYAVDLRESDELEASRALAERTYQDYESIFGPEHPYTLYARTNLGIVLRLLDQVEASYEQNSSAYELMRQRLGPDHVLTLTCATNLASDHAARGRHEAARDIDADILTRSRERLGPEHPSTLACALNLSFDLIAMGQADDGERLYAEVLSAYRRVLGERHPAIIAALARVRANCDVDPMPL